MSRLDSEAIDKAHLTEALGQFEPLWEVLTERERTRVVHLIVESVVVDPSGGDVHLIFHRDRRISLRGEVASPFKEVLAPPAI